MTPEPPAAAVANGHTLEWDPPAAVTAVLRWTCTTCGSAALDNRGHEYGSAVTSPCTAADEEAAR